MPKEEHIILKYKIDLRESAISDDEVIPFIKETIEEAKKKYSEKTKDLGKIEIADTGLRWIEAKFKADADIIILGIIISATLPKIIIDTWRWVVIPLIQKKLKIEEYKDNTKEAGYVEEDKEQKDTNNQKFLL